MIIHDAQLPVERFGLEEPEQTFRIKASAKAFKILSSNMYSNKILAVIREYTCNALDAHVVAGKENVPVELHLPSDLEPWFSVKDFGTGLSHEAVMTIYTTYFESLKTETNDQIGGLGIGGKSFFCYTDSFTVISRFNGVRRTYTAFMNEHGVPAITLMDEQDTDECNGLEVSGAVKPNDFYSFRTNAQNFLRRVTPMPVITGVPEGTLEINPIEQKYKGNGWHLIKDGENCAYATMGVVAYPIKIDSSLLTDAQNKLVNMPVEIYFKIGELDIAPSREALSFDKTSVLNLQKKLDIIIQEVRDYFQQQFINCPNLWEAKLLYWKIVNGELKAFKPLLDATKLEWRGQQINLHKFDLRTLQGGVHVEQYTPGYRPQVSRETVMDIPVEENPNFYINDLTIGGIARSRNFVKTNNKSMYCVNLVTTSEEDFAKAIGMDGVTFPRLSTLPKPIRVKGSISDKGKVAVLELDWASLIALGGCYNAVEDFDIVEEDFDIENGGFYVPIERYCINGNMKPRSFNEEYLKLLKYLDIDVAHLQVFGFKNKTMEKLRNSPELAAKWTNVKDYLKTLVKAKFDSTLYKNLANSAQVKDLEGLNGFDEFIPNIQPCSSFSPWTVFKEHYKQLKDETSKIQDLTVYATIANVYGLVMEEKDADFNLVKEFQQTLKQYPMLDILYKSMSEAYYYCREYANSHKEEINNYINVIDAQKNTEKLLAFS